MSAIELFSTNDMHFTPACLTGYNEDKGVARSHTDYFSSRVSMAHYVDGWVSRCIFGYVLNPIDYL